MKKIKALAGIVVTIFCIAGCGSAPAQTTPTSDTTPTVITEAAETEAAETAGTTEAETTEAEPEAPQASVPDSIKIAALKGPTAMGLTWLMDNKESTGLPYEFEIYAAVDEISPLLIQGMTDMACVPANLASVLYNKTEGEIEVLAINTLGVLYLVENGNDVSSFADLRGKTIFSSGKGATPEFALNYLLSSNGIDPENDVNIEWKSEHTECLEGVLENTGAVAMLPQPFVTTALTKNEGIRVAVDLNDEWDKLDNGSALLTGVIVGRKAFVEEYRDVIGSFLQSYAESVDYINNNVPEGAELVDKYGIVPAAVAANAIPYCNIVCISGSEMKEKLSGYLGVLYDQLPTSVGGALPADDFYYIAA